MRMESLRASSRESGRTTFFSAIWEENAGSRDLLGRCASRSCAAAAKKAAARNRYLIFVYCNFFLILQSTKVRFIAETRNLHIPFFVAGAVSAPVGDPQTSYRSHRCRTRRKGCRRSQQRQEVLRKDLHSLDSVIPCRKNPRRVPGRQSRDDTHHRQVRRAEGPRPNSQQGRGSALHLRSHQLQRQHIAQRLLGAYPGPVLEQEQGSVRI